MTRPQVELRSAVAATQAEIGHVCTPPLAVEPVEGAQNRTEVGGHEGDEDRGSNHRYRTGYGQRRTGPAASLHSCSSAYRGIRPDHDNAALLPPFQSQAQALR